MTPEHNRLHKLNSLTVFSFFFAEFGLIVSAHGSFVVAYSNEIGTMEIHSFECTELAAVRTQIIYFNSNLRLTVNELKTFGFSRMI